MLLEAFSPSYWCRITKMIDWSKVGRGNTKVEYHCLTASSFVAIHTSRKFLYFTKNNAEGGGLLLPIV